ncbi:DUF1707 SHOCT-like domain-containing protein, partial [Streptomyces sp. NPDC001940]
MTLPQENPARPISEDDRNSAVQRVQEAYAEGHISHEEMDDRLQQVLTARTHRELEPALASLPEEDAGTSSTIGALGGRITRRGAWKVPRNLKVESAFGGVAVIVGGSRRPGSSGRPCPPTASRGTAVRS